MVYPAAEGADRASPGEGNWLIEMTFNNISKTPARHLAALLLALALPALAAPPVLEDGYDAFERGDVARAVAIWRELAAGGNQTAQLNLGQLYRTGRGVPQDDAEAVKWYIAAGSSGSEMARYTLILMHQEGRATEPHSTWCLAVPEERS